MDAKIEQLLQATIKHWNVMLNPNVETLSDEFITTFYELTDARRDWVNEQNPRPTTLDALLHLPLVEHILAELPTELHLNFKTEAELIIENKTRVDG